MRLPGKGPLERFCLVLNNHKYLDLLCSLRPVSRETQAKFEQYVALLQQWQPKINLVGPSTMKDVWTRHVADSVQTFALHEECRTWIDLGSGAGFPGLVTAILLSDGNGGRVDLIESVGKKCAFMNAVIRETGLRDLGVDVRVHQGRIENLMKQLETPDAISARALASLEDLLVMTEGFLEQNCIGVFAKGLDHKREIEQARGRWDFDVAQRDSQFLEGSTLLTIRHAKRKQALE